MKTTQRIGLTLSVFALAALFAINPAMGRKEDPWAPETWFSASYDLVPPADSPEPAANGTTTQTCTVTMEPDPTGWSPPSYWYHCAVTVKCKQLTPTRMYRIVCHTSQGWDDIWDFMTEKSGKLDVSFSIGQQDPWFRGFTEHISVTAMEILDDAGNVVLVRVP